MAAHGGETAAVFGDVHSDLTALSAVLDDVAVHGISRIFGLGDTLGPGGCEPAQCLDLATQRCEVLLAGNHERWVGERVFLGYGGGFADYAAAVWNVLGADRRALLGALDSHARVEDLGVELVHGTLEDHEMGFLDRPSAARMHVCARGPVICAHTHEPRCFIPGPDDRALRRRIPTDREIELPERWVLNPGAVCDPDGPRYLTLTRSDGRWSARWHRLVPAAQ